MPTIGNFLHTQFVVKIPKPSTSFASKTVIVTGANSGLGKESVKYIITLGASKVIFGCRSLSRGKEAKQEIEKRLACSPSIIEVWELDLDSPSSIKSFADRANGLPRLDVLINNAGIRASEFKMVYDTEHTLAVNVIGTFLLTLQLIPKLKETARTYGVAPHLTFVGSALYDIAKYPDSRGGDVFAYFKNESRFKPQDQYNLSKLLQLYAAIKLSAILDQTGTANPTAIVINSLDPCFCKTGLHVQRNITEAVVFKIFEVIFARSAEEGARLVVQAASAGRETHGLYLRAGAVQEYHPIARDEKRVTSFWDLLCKRLEQLQPGILQNIK
ncbi:uncharacterized protein V1518DRAFT_391428 [Limtongia smithiae]|uniref:uncharacterized protein n=1 Tax=Limtongia smithiae TaxID=1125753 RepID=UPI0034CD1AF7